MRMSFRLEAVFAYRALPHTTSAYLVLQSCRIHTMQGYLPEQGLLVQLKPNIFPFMAFRSTPLPVQANKCDIVVHVQFALNAYFKMCSKPL